MRTVILTLKDAVETGLKDIDLLDKQDKVIFVYPKGKDSISIQVHTALAQLKCKVEFYEIPDENATKQDIPIYFAYLAGSSQNPAVIDTGSDLAKLAFLNIPRYPDFKSILSKKSVSGTSQVKTQRSKKPKAETPLKEEPAPKPAKENFMNIPEEKTPEKKAAPVKTVTPEPTPVKKAKPKAATPTGGNTMDDLKAYLEQNATETFNPASMTMSIFEAISNNVLKGTPINQALKESIIIESKVESVNHALQGKWGRVTDIVRGILKEKGKL